MKFLAFQRNKMLLPILIVSAMLLRTEGKIPKVNLVVSSLTSTRPFKDSVIRKLVINYYDADCDRLQRAFSFIALYDHDPKQGSKRPLFAYKPTDCPEGRIETNHSLPYIEFTTRDLKSKCMGFWVAYLEGGSVVHSNCIRTYPNWMSNIRKDIGNLTINCLMIPGTHNSGLYFKYNKLRDTIFEKYMYTQEESVFNQLVYGIRFLDLRVWHEGSKMWRSNMQITHDKFHLGLPSLKVVLKDVKKFVTATKEFVIIDFHRLFSGTFMSKTLHKWQHKDIVNLLKETFGSLIIGNEYADTKLEDLWKMNKRVLITYRDDLDSPESNYVTYPVFHWWTVAKDPKELHRYLIDNACNYPYYSTAAVAVLTPTAMTPFTDVTYSRRKTADKINNLVNKWFREELSCSNVILTDYFLGNNIIEIAIGANKGQRRCTFDWPDYQFGNRLINSDLGND